MVQTAGGVCLTVTDQGPGVAPDVLPGLSEACTSTDIASPTAGHGLSLASAWQIILAHQGTIGVESPPDVGTTLTGQLPHLACAASEEPLERNKAEAALIMAGAVERAEAGPGVARYP